MRISNKSSYNKGRIDEKKYRLNAHIKSEQVRLIDETGTNIGVVSTSKALEMAQDLGLDLVEVSPLANPPVAKIIDYSKLRYQEEKAKRQEKAKQKKIEIKGIRLSLRIGKGDLDIRVKRAVKFINQEDKVKIEMILRGRERQHTDLAKKIARDFIDQVHQEVGVKIEQNISILGGRLSAIFSKK